MTTSSIKAVNARIRYLKKALRELETTYKDATESGSFTPAVQAKKAAISVHAELEAALVEKARIQAAQVPTPAAGDALEVILATLEGLPRSVLEQLRKAIDELL